jgi:hypothetical protein
LRVTAIGAMAFWHGRCLSVVTQTTTSRSEPNPRDPEETEMKTTTLTAVAGFAIVAFSGLVASAQRHFVAGTTYGWPYSVYHHASTYEEGVLRGRADLYRGYGQYNYLSSLAAINYERARRDNLDNRVKSVETLFTMRKINQEARAAERRPRPTQQQLIRLAKSRVPDRLAEDQYEPALTELFWPSVLDDAEFAADRAEIDELMALRMLGDSGLGSENHRQITAAVDNMQSKLKARIRQMSTPEYITAKKFLTSLAYEARFAPSIEGLAAR